MRLGPGLRHGRCCRRDGMVAGAKLVSTVRRCRRDDETPVPVKTETETETEPEPEPEGAAPSLEPPRPPPILLSYSPLRAQYAGYSAALPHNTHTHYVPLSSHTGCCRCCQDIPWQIQEADRVANTSQKTRKSRSESSRILHEREIEREFQKLQQCEGHCTETTAQLLQRSASIQ